MSDNRLQYEAIRRYHRHQVRAGRQLDLEAAGREWISRFAALWRQHRSRRPART